MNDKTWLQEVQQADMDLHTIAGFIERFHGATDDEAQLIRARYRYLRSDLLQVKCDGAGRPETRAIKDLMADVLRRWEREDASDRPS